MNFTLDKSLERDKKSKKLFNKELKLFKKDSEQTRGQENLIDEIKKQHVYKVSLGLASEGSPNYEEVNEFINQDIPKGRKEREDLYHRMVLEYARLWREVRKMSEASARVRELRQFMGKEPQINAEFIEKDGLRDKLHKKIEAIGSLIGLDRSETELIIMQKTDGTLAELALPELVIRPPNNEKKKLEILFGFADSVGQSGGENSLCYRFQDRIGEQKIYVSKFGDWKGRVSRASNVFAFQKYLADTYPDIFEAFSREDRETHFVGVLEGVAVKTENLKKAAEIIRDEIGKFKKALS